MHVGYFRGSERIRSALEAKNIEYDFLVTEGESLVTRARNNMVATFLQSDFDVLCFLDADIEVEDGEAFVEMLELPGIRGGAVSMKTNDLSQALSAWVETSVPGTCRRLVRSELEGKKARPVLYIGAAVMAIDRSVLESLADAHPELRYTDHAVGQAHALFEPAIVNGAYLSEDYGFCELAKRAGHQILVHPSLVVRHYGAMFWRW